MNNHVASLLSGTAILIGMYLILTNPKSTTSIINQLGNTYVGGVKALQGR